MVINGKTLNVPNKIQHYILMQVLGLTRI